MSGDMVMPATVVVTCSDCGERMQGECQANEGDLMCGERVRGPHKRFCPSSRAKQRDIAQLDALESIASSGSYSGVLRRIASNFSDGEPYSFWECFLPRPFRVWLHRYQHERRYGRRYPR